MAFRLLTRNARDWGPRYPLMQAAPNKARFNVAGL
jgi:hypothetical protein